MYKYIKKFSNWVVHMELSNIMQCLFSSLIKFFSFLYSHSKTILEYQLQNILLSLRWFDVPHLKQNFGLHLVEQPKIVQWTSYGKLEII